MVAGHWPLSLSALTRTSFLKDAMCQIRFDAGCSIQNISFRVSEFLTCPVREYLDTNELID